MADGTEHQAGPADRTSATHLRVGYEQATGKGSDLRTVANAGADRRAAHRLAQAEAAQLADADAYRLWQAEQLIRECGEPDTDD